jgi:transposase
MVKVDDYARIRRAHFVDGLSIKAIARQFHHSRRKIRQILTVAEPKPYIRLNPPPSVLDPFKPIIDGILQADEEVPRKQRHTVAKLYRRLRQEHDYSGGYDRVRRYVGGRGRQRRETFIPLDHDPGQRLEADFGHIHVDFPEGRRLVPVLMVTWAYSNCPFAMALPSERTEAVLNGMVEAFEFFGCVPREVWWDNPKTVVPHLLKGRSRQVNLRYAALASHYNFEPLFCMVRRPQEKPRVEGRVQFLQQDWATPLPQVHDMAALNRHLRDCCQRDRQRTQAGQQETIDQRFAQERDRALPLPGRRFDPCILQPAKVDKYQTARFDGNAYSVPRSLAFQTVTVKGYVERVDVVAGAQVIASHPRSYGKGEQILDPLHYLVTLGRRPAALDHANVYRHWQLPAVFGDLRGELERQQGPAAGARQYIRVLQLLAEHPLERVQCAIEDCRQAKTATAATIADAASRLAERSTQASRRAECQPFVTGDPLYCQPLVSGVRVPLPNLRLFDQLLTREEVLLDPEQCFVAEGQLETTATAGDACRV